MQLVDPKAQDLLLLLVDVPVSIRTATNIAFMSV